MGKPSSKYFLNALAILNCKNENVTIIGDDWKTDILGAKEVGLKTILVKSGKYNEGDEYRSKPDIVVNNLLEINEKTVLIS